MTALRDVKTLSLAVLIGLAVLVRFCSEARAAETEELVVAGGCFWCVEADFEKVKGVGDVVSGFTGGDVADPTYKQVVAGGTGHLEAVRIPFDPSVISRETLLAMFLRSVDPTDTGGQFCDRGDSYRTAIFVSDKAEKDMARRVREQAQAELGQPIVTPIEPLTEFYPADSYHQDYYKGSKLVFTRFGPKRKSEAYKRYRMACGRDQRVRQLWGDAAPFAGS